MKLTLLAILVAHISFSQFQVGHTTLTFNDPSRTGGFGSGGGTGRQIQTEVYYPALTAGDNTTIVDSIFPLLVFGHGFAMSWDAYANIWQRYASQGYILAFPRTEGSIFPSPSHADFGSDLALVNQKMVANTLPNSSSLTGHISSKNAILGHSMGGGATILSSTNNTTLTTLICLAPAETTPSAIQAATNVTVPSLLFSGDGDGVTAPANDHQPIFYGLSSIDKYFVSILGGGHCFFANQNSACDLGEQSTSGNITITRSKQQQLTYNYLDHWLNYYLKDNCASLDSLVLYSNSPVSGTSTISPSPNFQAPVITISGDTLTCLNPADSYVWFLNGSPIPNANSQTILSSASGNFSVQTINGTSCPRKSIEYAKGSIGLEEKMNRELIPHPNPVSDMLYITNAEYTDNISIYTIENRLLEQKKYENGISITDLSNGYYIVQINEIRLKILVAKK